MKTRLVRDITASEAPGFSENVTKPFKTSWAGYLRRSCDDEPLRSPTKGCSYFRGLIPDGICEETLWLISMNPGRHPLALTQLGQGSLVSVAAIPRNVFQIALEKQAYSIVIARTIPSLEVKLSDHDLRAIRQCGAAAQALDLEFADYLVLSTLDELQGPQFVSWSINSSRE